MVTDPLPNATVGAAYSTVKCVDSSGKRTAIRTFTLVVQ
jgi:hypothetical protein